MRKGKALIEARTICGPATHVQQRGLDYVILNEVGGALLDYGRSWGEAIENLKKSQRGKHA